MKKNAKQITFVSMLLVITILLLSGCANSERKQQKIIDTFASFENAKDYVFVTRNPDCLYVGENVIELEKLTYKDIPCHYISTTPECAYFYALHSESTTTVDILSFSYQTLKLSFIATVEVENEIRRADHHNGEVYFELIDNSYLIYNIETTKTRNAEYDEVSSDIFRNYQSEKYTISEFSRSDISSIKLSIKNNQTGEEKKVGYSLLKTCEEGREIMRLGSEMHVTSPMNYYEHNGEIYIVYIYLIDGFWGYPCSAYVMKYDFDSHTMQYYTSVFMTDFPEGGLLDFKIPNETIPNNSEVI